MSNPINEFGDQADCFSSHMGTWAMDVNFANEMLAHLKAGFDGFMQSRFVDMSSGMLSKEIRVESFGTPFSIDESSGVAVISLNGPTQKGESKFGGTSSIGFRQSIRAIGADDRINALMIRVDSPGGQSAGTQELGEEVTRLAGQKPVVAQVDDMAASAAVWAISGATKIVINRAGEIGSIGTYAVIHDQSEMFKREGIKVIKVAAGDAELKGAFIPGTKVTNKQIKELSRRVNSINSLFLQSIADGRGLDLADVEKMATGGMFSAEEALKMGLVDAIQSADDTLSEMVSEFGNKQKRSSRERSEHQKNVLADLDALE